MDADTIMEVVAVDTDVMADVDADIMDMDVAKMMACLKSNLDSDVCICNGHVGASS